VALPDSRPIQVKANGEGVPSKAREKERHALARKKRESTVRRDAGINRDVVPGQRVRGGIIRRKVDALKERIGRVPRMSTTGALIQRDRRGKHTWKGRKSESPRGERNKREKAQVKGDPNVEKQATLLGIKKLASVSKIGV